MKKLIYPVCATACFVAIALSGCGAGSSDSGNEYNTEYAESYEADEEAEEEASENSRIEALQPYVGVWTLNMCNQDMNNGKPLGYMGQLSIGIYRDGTFRYRATELNDMLVEEITLDLEGLAYLDGENLYLVFEDGSRLTVKARNGRLYNDYGESFTREN